jgi:hypothetical protein
MGQSEDRVYIGDTCTNVLQMSVGSLGKIPVLDIY